MSAHEVMERASPDAIDPATAAIRKEFPVLARKVHGRPLVYLDNAASSQKPLCVIEAVADTYKSRYANIHRGVHCLSQMATEAYEGAREKVRAFIHARESREIIFVRGATEGINLVAQTFGRRRLREGDEILLTAMEHHSNIVPWQILCEQTMAKLRVVPVSDKGDVDLEAYQSLLSEKTRLAGIVHVSNALGTVNPVRRMIAMAHRNGTAVLLDGAQAAPHMAVDVQDLDCDFYTFSGHKMYGPSGIGVLYGKADLLEDMPPYQGGGDMIRSVTFEKTIYNGLPYKFEAGTPNIVGAIGLGAAIDWMEKITMDRIRAVENGLLAYATQVLSDIEGVRMIGSAARKAGLISFMIDGVHPHDVGTILDREGIAIRAGHHCAQPLMRRFGIPATARASFAVYNTKGEIDALARGIAKVQELFA